MFEMPIKKFAMWTAPLGLTCFAAIVCSRMSAALSAMERVTERIAPAVQHLINGYPGLALMASGMSNARAERLSYAYRVDRLWPARALRLSFYVSIRLGSRLSIWPELAGCTARRLPVLHKSLSYSYRRSLPPQTRPLVVVQYNQQPTFLIGPAQRRVQKRLELLRRAAGAG